MNRVLLSLLALSCAACETVIDVAAPPHEPQLVAQSFFTPDSVWVVRVTPTVAFTSPDPPGWIEDAVVEIRGEDGLFVQPVWTDSGTYIARGGGAVAGWAYTLRVTAPGYAPSEGHDVLPAPPRITTFNTTPVEPEEGGSRRRLTHVEITIQDSAASRDYYGLLVVQARGRLDRITNQLTPLPPSLFPFESDNPALGESLFDFLDSEKTFYREAFFTDELFNGTPYTLDFDLQYDVPAPGAQVSVERVFSVVLLTVSEHFYHYWKTAGEQFFTNENPFAEPLRVHSNMTNGFGVFAGFQYRFLPVGPDSLGIGAPYFADLCRLASDWLPVFWPTAYGSCSP